MTNPKNRVIPVLTLYKKRIVKTINFDKFYDVGDPKYLTKYMNSQDVDELIIIDINNDEKDLETLEIMANECQMPLVIGGGIDNLKNVDNFFNIGADKILINTKATDNILINEISKKYGSQSIIVSIDLKIVNGKYYPYISNGSIKLNESFQEYLLKINNDNIGEYFINSIDRDGTMLGFDLDLADLTRNLIKNKPIIFMGGGGMLSDYLQLQKKYNFSGLGVGSLFHFSDNKPVKLNAYLRDTGKLNFRFI